MNALSELKWIDGQTLEFAGQRFLASADPKMYGTKSTLDRFLLLKAPLHLQEYARLAEGIRPKRIVELGIWQGGSIVLFQKAFSPQKLVAFDLAKEPLAVLDEYIVRNGLQEVIKPYYGVNQADSATMGPILDREFREDGIDLVIDDASHLVDETRASFNLLFPRLRAGGAYVIEDWDWEHRPVRTTGDPFVGKQAMTNLIFELTMTLATDPAIISRVSIARGGVIVTRGEQRLGPDFDISRSYAIRDPRDFASLVESIRVAPSILVARRIRRSLTGYPLAGRLWDAAARRLRRIR